MTRTNLTIAGNWTSIVITAVLMMLTILLNSNSTGYIKGGDDDEGSGIGGTGRMPGLLGSMPFKPILGLNQTRQEIYIVDSVEEALTLKAPEEFSSAKVINFSSKPEQRLLSAPFVAPIQFSGSDLVNSDALSIRVALQSSLKAKALFYQLPVANSQRSEVITATTSQPGQQITSPWWQLQQLIVAEIDADAINETPIDSEAPSPDTTTRSADVFKRIQRPTLPPILRIRPVERITVLPPRIQRMRI